MCDVDINEQEAREYVRMHYIEQVKSGLGITTVNYLVEHLSNEVIVKTVAMIAVMALKLNKYGDVKKEVLKCI